MVRKCGAQLAESFPRLTSDYFYFSDLIDLSLKAFVFCDCES